MTKEQYVFELGQVAAAELIASKKYTDESIHVKYSNGKYSLQSRIHDLGGVEWTYHFPLTLEQAREIVSKGYATWWSLVAESVR